MSSTIARYEYDAVIVGSGPNGLSAAVALAREGLSTLVVEGADSPGGGARSKRSTLPGFVHDVCSTVHPLGVGSPFFRTLPLEQYGLRWVHPRSPLAHVLDDGSAVMLERSLTETAAALGPDGERYQDLMAPFVEHFDSLMQMILGPLRFPSSPLLLGRFGLEALKSLNGLTARFESREVPALLAGMAAHAMLPLDRLATASFGLVLASAAHAVGWPVAAGGSQSITNALVDYLKSLGGELQLDRPVHDLDSLPRARAYLLDLTPRQVLEVARHRLPESYARRLERFRYGVGVFKMDFALSEPIPWKDRRCAQAATVHVGGDQAAVARAEAAAHEGRLAENPFLLVVQASPFDSSRAPAGSHTGWAYCHVPAGSEQDLAESVESRIEGVAPGFRSSILARAARTAAEVERYNPNYVGGDINGGIADLRQLFFRPVARVDPYTTPAHDVFLCSSSTPPGGGVHGMCGYWAARSALRRVFGRRAPSALTVPG